MDVQHIVAFLVVTLVFAAVLVLGIAVACGALKFGGNRPPKPAKPSHPSPF